MTELQQMEDAVAINAPASASLAASTSAMEASEAIDRLRTMMIQEDSPDYRCVDYLACSAVPVPAEAASTGEAGGKPIDAACRLKMCRWSEQVVDFCQFSRETVSIAMSYLDRFLSASVTTSHPAARRARISRREYQLASMTALYMAVKLNEPLEMDTELVSELSRGCYTAQEIADAEMNMLNALRWRTSGPTPLGFLQHFLALLPQSSQTQGGGVAEALLDLGRRQTELAVSDYSLVPLRPSIVAVAALMNAMNVTGDAMSPEEKFTFLREVRDSCSVDLTSDEVRKARLILGEALGDITVEIEPSTPSMTEGEAQETEAEPELRQEEEETGGSARGDSGKAGTRLCSGTWSPVCVSKR